MKHLLLVFILFAIVPICKAQTKYLNTKTPYSPQQKKYTPPPKGYAPVFINYVGRHGARFQTSADKDLMIVDILQQAQKANALTSAGASILQQIQSLEKIEENNYGNITMLGNEEQKTLAERMQSEYPAVFSGGKLLVEMTEKIRTQQSAKAFLSGLNGYDPASVKSYIFPAGTDSILRFYDLSAAYKSYAASPGIKKHIDSLLNDDRITIAANEVCKKMFMGSFIDQLKNGDIRYKTKSEMQAVSTVNFSMAIYEIYASMFSTSKELGSNYKVVIATFNKIFSDQDLLWLDMINSASDFYEKGPAEDANGIQVTIAAPLLRDLMNTTDSAIQMKKFDAILRFTHAEAISPLATLMGIPHASKTSNSVFTFSDVWNASEIIPMSANIQWILYSNGKRFLVKILLNEKEVTLPIDTKIFPYYNWNDVRSYYLNKISSVRKK